MTRLLNSVRINRENGSQMCVCVCERESKTETERERERERERDVPSRESAGIERERKEYCEIVGE